MDPRDLVVLLAVRWKRLLSSTVICGLLGLIALILLPAYYRAKVVLAPAAPLSSNTGGLAGLASQFGGLASLAGVDLGAASADKSTITLETLRGATFLVEFAKRRDLVVPLFAGKSYDPIKGEWKIDPDVYDIRTDRWTRRVSPPRVAEPSDFEIYTRISRRVSVDEDRRTGVVRVTVESKSAELSVKWAGYLVQDLNDYLRSKDIEEAQRTIKYLQDQVDGTQVSEMRNIFFKLIEEQTKTLMLARVRPEYALKVIDPPLRPDQPAWPKRDLLVALAALAGFALATMTVLVPFSLLFRLRQDKRA